MLEVPHGALSETVELSIRPSEEPLPRTVGPAYVLGPPGTQFRAPVRLTISYRDEDHSAVLPQRLQLATFVDDQWHPLEDVTSEPGAVSGKVDHFSVFAVVAAPPANELVLDEQTGTTFTIGGVTLQSSQSLHLLSMSVWEKLILLSFEGLGAPSATFSFQGLRPNATLYAYDGGYQKRVRYSQHRVRRHDA
jgi:hypothetical protein